MRQLKWLWIFVPVAAVLAGLSGSYMLPLEHDAIQYSKAPVNDPVSKLQHRIDAGEVQICCVDAIDAEWLRPG